MKKTPRQEIKELKTLKTGYYCFYNTRIIQIEKEIWHKAVKLLNSINVGVVYSRQTYSEVYEMLLDGVAIKNIKTKYSVG